MLRVSLGRRFLAFFAIWLLFAALVLALPQSVGRAAPAAAKCPATVLDEAAASRAAAGCHGRVEVGSARSEKSQVFANANGSFTATSAAVAQRVRRADGSWVRPDPTLHTGADGRIAPSATALRISFSGGGTGALATIGKDAAELGLRWPSALPVPTTSGSSVKYAEVFPGVDLVLTAQVEGFAEMLVVKSAAAAANPALSAVRFATTTKGLRLGQDSHGELTAVDNGGATLFGSGTPAMWDSTTTAGGQRTASRLTVPGGAMTAMPVELSGADLVVHPDVAMLRATTTRYPVYIDPAFARSAWTMINSRFPDQSYWSFDRQDCPAPYASIQCAKVGYTTDPQTMIYRSLFAFPTGTLLGKHVQDAKLSMDTVYSFTDTNYGTEVHIANGINTITKWSNNASTWGTVVATANSHAHDKVRRRTEWGVTSAAQSAVGHNLSTLTLGLRAVSESNENQWKKFDAGTALLTVTYNSYPNAPDRLTIAGAPCTTGAARPYVRTLTPELRARVSDPDGSARLLKGTFQWWKLTGGARNATDAVAQGSVVSGQTAIATIPAGRLADGVTYVVQAIANDGIDSGQYSTTCEFTIDVTLPPAPDQVTSTDYPSDGQGHGGVGTAGSFTVRPPSAVPADFSGYAYTLDPGASAATATQVTANSTDHGATISLVPTTDQAFNLRVWSRDVAGNFSTSPIVYPFTVRAGTGPDGQWSFDERTGATTADNSGHGNAATIIGSAWTTGRGGVGGALVADGTSTAAATTGSIATRDPNTGGPVTVHSNGSFTIAATVRLDSTAGAGQRVVVAQDGVRTSPFQLSYSVADKKWRFAVAATDADSPVVASVLSNAVVAAGVWTNLVAMYDGTSHQLRLYVGGVLQTATATSTTFDASGPVTIGRARLTGAPAGFFAGAIDDVRVYARTIIATEREFTNALRPNPPLMSFPNGTAAYTGKPVQAVLSAGGDAAVTKVQYRLDASGTWTTVTLPTAGGQATVTVTPSAEGKPLLLAVGLDAAGRQSDIASQRLDITAAPALAGRVTDASTGAAVAAATVELIPGGLTQTTDSSGGYSFTGISAGGYTVTASSDAVGCAALIAATEIDVVGAVSLDLQLQPQADVYGYTCSAAAATPLISGTTKVALTGDDEIAKLTGLPFKIPFYGGDYDAAWISTNGALAFVDPPGGHISWDAVSLPDRDDAPRGAVAPFWDDLVLDGQAGVWTATTGAAPNQKYVVEWRNVLLLRDQAGPRFSFEVVFSQNGDIVFNYAGLNNDSTRGSNAAMGITSPGGGYGLQYSFETPSLTSGTAITFRYPEDPQPIPRGTLSGTLTSGEGAASGATVWLGSVTTVADDSGRYQFNDVEGGLYDVEAEAGCASASSRDVAVVGEPTLDLGLTAKHDTFGYSCDIAEVPFVPGVSLLKGADQPSGGLVQLPFGMPFYGNTFSEVIVAPLGTVDFESNDPHMIGSVYTCRLNDIEADDAASIWTTTAGAGPDRKLYIEWRNVRIKGSPGKRITFEVALSENGVIAVIYQNVGDPDGVQSVRNAQIWQHDYHGIGYTEDGRSKQVPAVVFHPPAS